MANLPTVPKRQRVIASTTRDPLKIPLAQYIPAKTSRSTTRLFIQGLNPKIHAGQLAGFLGSAWKYRRLIVPMIPGTGLNRTYAFIDFDDAHVAQLFIEAFNGIEYEWRTWQVHPIDARPPHVQLPPDDLVVFNLTPGTTEDQLYDQLGRDHRIRGIHISYYKAATKGLGFGFIKLHNRDDMADVIYEHSGKTIAGNIISIRTAKKGEKPQSRGIYTIDIPGIQDFIRIPAMEDVALRVQRLARFETYMTPRPRALDWPIAALQWLDDHQDFLYTALVLAKPIFRRLPARFLPVVGGILLVNDVMNLLSGLLAIPVTGRFGKRLLYGVLDVVGWSKARRLSRYAEFMHHTDWVAFGLQAAQVSYNVTGYIRDHYTAEGQQALRDGRHLPGYGLTLGAWMGMVSDLTWAGIRAIHGDSLTFRLPPPADPLGKALRVLNGNMWWKDFVEGLSVEDHTMIALSTSAALRTIQDAGYKPPLGNIEAYRNTIVSTWAAFNDATLTALDRAGMLFLNHDAPDFVQAGPEYSETGQRRDWSDITRSSPYHEDVDFPPKNFDAMRFVPDGWSRTTRYLGNATQGKEQRQILASALQSASDSAYEIAGGPDAVPRPMFSHEEIAALHAVEYNVRPKPGPDATQLQAWLVNATEKAIAAGAKEARQEDLIKAAKDANLELYSQSELDRMGSGLFEGEYDLGPLPAGVKPPGF